MGMLLGGPRPPLRKERSAKKGASKRSHSYQRQNSARSVSCLTNCNAPDCRGLERKAFPTCCIQEGGVEKGLAIDQEESLLPRCPDSGPAQLVSSDRME